MPSCGPEEGRHLASGFSAKEQRRAERPSLFGAAELQRSRQRVSQMPQVGEEMCGACRTMDRDVKSRKVCKFQS